MRTLVLGSGIVGTTTAYYLARAGHQVTVIDRQAGAGLETSFANAGQVSPGYSAPWAAPGIPLKAVKWLLSEYSPLIIAPRLDGAMLRFALRMLRNCTQTRYDVNKSRMLRIAEYSRQAFAELRAETEIRYDHRERGTLQLFRTNKQLKAASKDIAILERCGVPYELLDVDGCVAAEPALDKVRDKLAGGLRLPLDETGDCYRFTDQLATHAKALGVEFLHGIDIHELVVDRGRVTGAMTSQGAFSADAVIVALGSYSQPLLAKVGIDLPIYPVKGYSITLPIEDAARAPVSTVMDETYKVAVTRLGDRIRAAGTAELTGFDLSLKEKRRKTVTHVVSDLFPGAGEPAQAEFWTGLRPMTPDGTPVLGETPLPGLYLNTGHGTLGWTMSCGSGRLLADIVSGRQTEIDMNGLRMDRYRFATRGLKGARNPQINAIMTDS